MRRRANGAPGLNWREDYYEEGYLNRWALGRPGAEEFELADQFLGLGRAAPGSAVLDLGCGHGRFSLGMASRGAHVVGLDGSWSLLERAKSFERDLRYPVRWVRADMRQIPFGPSFDMVLTVDTFGNSDSDAEELEALREVRRVLRKGGRLVMRNPNGALIRAEFRAEQEEVQGGKRITVRSTLSKNGEWLEQWIEIEDEERRQEYRRRQRIYTPEELTTILNEAGFRLVQHFADVEGSPVQDKRSPRLISVGR